MKINFLFRNYASVRKYLAIVLLVQFAGVIIFVLSALILWILDIQQEHIVLYSSICVFVFALFFIKYRYETQFLFIKTGLWPDDDDVDLVSFLRKAVKQIKIQNTELSDMQYRTEKLLTDNVQMRRSAESIRASANFLKDLSTSYNKILEIRARVKESRNTAETLLSDYTQTLKMAEEGRNPKEIIDVMKTLQKMREEQGNLRKLKRKERQIIAGQNAMFRAMST